MDENPIDFDTLEANIKKYLLLADTGVIKLLCAAVVANRLPQLDPTWLFLVSSSSGGKSELLLALAYADGLVQKDDLTAKTFISGARSGGTETSLLQRLPANAIMVIKDLSVLLKKDQREADAIFSQLRMIYDGTFNKSFGTGEDKDIKVRLGLIAGVTSVIEDYQGDEAAVGQRAILYYMKQPSDEEVDDLTTDILGRKEDKSKRVMIGASFKAYLDGNRFENIAELPDLPLEIRREIAMLSNMATKARSSIKRKKYDRNNRIERENLREMPFRFAKQLGNLATAMMVMNHGQLTKQDKKILYQIALDSIPSERKRVMQTATRFESSTLEGLAIAMDLPTDSAQIHVDDLVKLKIMAKHRGFSEKLQYQLNPKWRELISTFENIEMTDKVLDNDSAPLEPEPPPARANEVVEVADFFN